MTPSRPILVATCGNELAGADGFGPSVAELLRRHLPSRVELLEMGTSPASLMDRLANHRELIIVDAVCAPNTAAGEVIEFDWCDPARPELVSERPVSTHGLSISQQLDLAGALGSLPPVVRVMGMTIPPNTRLGDALPQQSILAAREIVRRIECHAATSQIPSQC